MKQNEIIRSFMNYFGITEDEAYSMVRSNPYLIQALISATIGIAVSSIIAKSMIGIFQDETK